MAIRKEILQVSFIAHVEPNFNMIKSCKNADEFASELEKSNLTRNESDD